MIQAAGEPPYSEDAVSPITSRFLGAMCLVMSPYVARNVSSNERQPPAGTGLVPPL